ncbi:hypothetical protein [Agarivorans sp. JK6]|uniref:hypothetical protein n=1 Tax=Agarivorans sp. JK6 TaxID=2997426 RepID=UPI003872C889
MKLATIYLALFLLSGCGTEGVDMEISDVDGWFKVNESEITSIVELFKNDRCLRRVELGSMKYIRQNCKSSPLQETKIKEIQSKLTNLGVVLAVAYTFDNGNFVANILINRRGIGVSGGGLRISYWETFPLSLNDELECGAIENLYKEKWYAEILSSEDSCL